MTDLRDMIDLRDIIIIVGSFIIGSVVGTCSTQKELLGKDIVKSVDATYRKIQVNDSLEVYIPYQYKERIELQ